MRFVPGGIDIPEALIEAQEKGEVIFVCGAGVSKRVGLPLFGELVEGVYRRLNEDRNGYLPERESFERGEFDRTLGLLERRIGEQSAREAPHMRRRILEAVRAELAVPEAQLLDHAALLTLSRNVRQETCLVTTNFDTLFERASPVIGQLAVASHAGSALPGPQSGRFSGVLHLHGRLKDDELHLDDSDLILTSPQFGDAYMRSGWAARWIYDLARTSTIILVGYAADDPPMRYLLETLDADRLRFPDLKPIYAFASERNGDDSAALDRWRAKGIIPIGYPERSHHGHDALYDTLREWARSANDTEGWRTQRLRAILEGEPTPEGTRDAETIIRSLDGSRLLAEINPDARWVEPLAKRKLTSEDRPTPAGWITKRLDDPNHVQAWAAHSKFGGWTRQEIERVLNANAMLPDAFRVAWRAILAHGLAPTEIDRHDTHLAVERVRCGDFRSDVVDTLVVALKPRLQIHRPVRFPDDREAPSSPAEFRLGDLVRIEFEAEGLRGFGEIRSTFSAHPEHAAKVIRRLAEALESALEEAEEYGVTHPDFDLTSFVVHSVSRHTQDAHSHGFYPIVRELVDLIEDAARSSAALPLQYVERWLNSRFLLLRRVALHFCSLQETSGRRALEALLALSDSDFWDSDIRRESMRLMALRWPEFPLSLRNRLETRIRRGIPVGLFHSEIPRTRVKQHRAYQTYIRLCRLRSAGHALGDLSLRKIAQFERRYPKMRASEGERDDFSRWSESRSGFSGDPAKLAGVPPAKLIETARSIEANDPFDQSDLTQVVMRVEPQRFWQALLSDLHAGKTDERAWSSYLSTNASAAGETAEEIASALGRMNDTQLRPIAYSISYWLRMQHAELLKAKVAWPQHLDRLLERLIAETLSVPAALQPETIDDPSTAILTTTEGHIAEIAVSEVVRLSPSEIKRRKTPLERLTRLVEAGGRGRTIALIECCRRLARLHYLAPEWVERHVVPHLLDGPLRRQLWRAKSWDGHPGTPALVNALAPVWLGVLASAELPADELERLLDALLLAHLWQVRGNVQGYDISAMEVKKLLRSVSAQLRHHVIWLMARWIEGEKDAAQAWRTIYGPMLDSIWPLDASLRDAESTQRFVDLAAAAGEAFPAALQQLLPLLVSDPDRRVGSLWSLDIKDRAIATKYPGETLTLLDHLIRLPAQAPYKLDEALQDISRADATLAADPRYRRLRRLVAASKA